MAIPRDPAGSWAAHSFQLKQQCGRFVGLRRAYKPMLECAISGASETVAVGRMLTGQVGEEDMDVIYSYSRKQAIDDGVLIDVGEMGKEAGIKFPIAITSAVWNKYVEVPDGVSCQDKTGRLWDIVWMLYCRIAGSRDIGTHVLFRLYVRNTNEAADLVTLKAVCGPGDDGDPVITVMLPNED